MASAALPPDFEDARQTFLAYLRYTRGYSPGTCYGYRSDLGLWGRWLVEAGQDWRRCSHVQVEQFITWQARERGARPPIIARRAACLSSFYKWSLKQRLVDQDPVYLADKPKRPYRIPIWLEKDEQKRLQAAARDIEDLPETIFGRTREHVLIIRRRYDLLFGLIQHSGVRVSEALGLRVRDVRVVDGVARSIKVIGKGNKERVIPLPDGFGQMFGFWLGPRGKEEFVFAKREGAPPPGPAAVRAYLRRLVDKAGLDKPVTPHKLRHTYATRLLESGAQLVDIQALLGHSSLATTQIYTHVGANRMAEVVAKL